VRFDARGHAQSPAPKEARAYRPEAFVADVAALVGNRGPAIIGGLSMGAGVALRCALERPEIVRALILCAPPRGGAEQKSWAREFAQAIDEKGLEAAGSEFVWGARSRFDPRGARLIRQGFLEHQPHAIAHVLRELIAKQPSISELEPRLKRLELPTLVVVGTRDTASLEAAEALSAIIPRARLERIAGAGHVVNLAAPDEFNSRLIAFLKSLD
jgi:pimeloyl-ACP methyl ester carboxylesterase